MESIAESVYASLDASLDQLSLTLMAHDESLTAYVAQFRETRKQELEEINRRKKLGTSHYPGLLLTVRKKSRAISTKKYIQSDYDEMGGKKLVFSQLNLAVVSGDYSEYIRVNANGTYNPKRVVRFANIRAYAKADKEWVEKVVMDVNALNQSGLQLRDAYLNLAECHYEALKRYDLNAMKRSNFVDHDESVRSS